MMLKGFVTAIFVLLTAASTVAATDEIIVIVPRPKTDLENSSVQKRTDKDYLLTMQLFGSSAHTSGIGFFLGNYLDSNTLLQLELSFGSGFGGFKEEDSYTGYGNKSKVLGAAVKNFHGNSFYTKLGVNHRQITYEGSGFRADEIATGVATSLTGDFALGNQWQWDSFTMGVDWIGFNPVLIELSTKMRNTVTDSKQRDLAEKRWKEVAQTTSVQFLRFYLGASF